MIVRWGKTRRIGRVINRFKTTFTWFYGQETSKGLIQYYDPWEFKYENGDNFTVIASVFYCIQKYLYIIKLIISSSNLSINMYIRQVTGGSDSLQTRQKTNYRKPVIDTDFLKSNQNIPWPSSSTIYNVRSFMAFLKTLGVTRPCTSFL